MSTIPSSWKWGFTGQSRSEVLLAPPHLGAIEEDVWGSRAANSLRDANALACGPENVQAAGGGGRNRARPLRAVPTGHSVLVRVCVRVCTHVRAPRGTRQLPRPSRGQVCPSAQPTAKQPFRRSFEWPPMTSSITPEERGWQSP